MGLTYKTRQFYRRLFRVLLILVMAALIVLLCWVLWLRRFLIYTDDGVRLDFGLSQQWPLGETGQAKDPVTHPDIYFTQTETKTPSIWDDDIPFAGYHVTVEELQTELDSVLEQILRLPEGTPVMLDVKGYWGYFYYTSECGSSSASFDMATMDAFFEAINESGVYAIARLPAFRDYTFALANQSCGLAVPQGYLWVDDDYCYWLDPSDEGTMEFLIQIIHELQAMGFDEVAFLNFCYPDTDQIVIQGDPVETIARTAKALVNACSDSNFAVSFITSDPTFPLPEGNSRLYLQDVAAADVQTVLLMMDQATVDRTVFFTYSNDTRYDVCGVIKPLSMAQ